MRPKVRNFFRETGMLVHTSRASEKKLNRASPETGEYPPRSAAPKTPRGFFKGQTVIAGINYPFPHVSETGSEAITQSRINLVTVSQ
jgi:hypothetical protein